MNGGSKWHSLFSRQAVSAFPDIAMMIKSAINIFWFYVDLILYFCLLPTSGITELGHKLNVS
jgi:hypothetical protein